MMIAANPEGQAALAQMIDAILEDELRIFRSLVRMDHPVLNEIVEREAAKMRSELGQRSPHWLIARYRAIRK